MASLLPQVEAWLASLPTWQAWAALAAASLVGAWLVTVFTERVLRRAVRRTENRLDEVVLAELRLPVAASVALAGGYLAGDWLHDGSFGFYLTASVLSAAVAVWGLALARLGDRVIELVDEESEVADFAPIFENLWTFAVLVGGLFAVLSVWQVDVTPLLASAGIAGIAVGFAAKDTVANFFGSIALYVDGTYTVGDYVKLDSGDAGTVVDISIRSTRLVTRDHVVVTVPNSVLNSARIVNRSGPRPHTRVRVPVGVAYGSDIDAVESALLDVAEDEDLVVDNPHPRVRFRGFGDSALEYELLAYVSNPMADARAKHRLNRGIYRRFREDGVEIPFPQRIVTVEDGSRDGDRALAPEPPDGGERAND
jgi:small-conductance mechanosensitive channel